ncbi:MAG: CDP-alcohol phosphatidyltransferase family protein [Nitriliruptorales bacterium]|nr:CDP-alcohol phosphatidyltransferase family protein [Nitriliruptorales bacterium]
MFDASIRRRLAGPLDAIATRAARLGIGPNVVTFLGLALALASAVAAARTAWPVALVLWLASRAMDTLDGPVARALDRDSELGGLLDIISDFVAYGAFVVGCGIGVPDARVACLVLLATYYVNGATFLAYSSMVERRGLTDDLADDRSLVFLRGLAEGSETVVAHSLMASFPTALVTIAWVFAGAVAVTILQRLARAVRVLG